MKSILIIGSLNMDASIRVSRFPVPGETLLGESVRFIPGGKGANQAVAAGRLAAESKVAMIGCIGSDSFGSTLISSLKQANVDTSGVQICSNCSSGFAVVTVDTAGHNQIVVIPGSNSQCNEDYIRSLDSVIQDADYVMLQMEIPAAAVYYAIHRAKELGKTVILNPAPAPDCLPPDILQKIDYLVPNETELMRLSGREGNSISDFADAAKAFVRLGVGHVIVTLGDKGALIVDWQTEELVPSCPVSTVDTVAAGDCFNAAMVVALSEGHTLIDAVRFANQAASVAVSRKGAQDSLPWRKDIC